MQINLSFDRFNNSSFYNVNDKVLIRPFRNNDIELTQEVTLQKAKYEVCLGNYILSKFFYLEQAKKYIDCFINKNLSINIFRVINGSESDNYILAYDVSYNTDKWIYLRKIN